MSSAAYMMCLIFDILFFNCGKPSFALLSHVHVDDQTGSQPHQRVDW